MTEKWAANDDWTDTISIVLGRITVIAYIEKDSIVPFFVRSTKVSLYCLVFISRTYPHWQTMVRDIERKREGAFHCWDSSESALVTMIRVTQTCL